MNPDVDLAALLNSSDREVRIAARRQRIQARIAAKRQGDGDGANPTHANPDGRQGLVRSCGGRVKQGWVLKLPEEPAEFV
jgi:hypothetical protein